MRLFGRNRYGEIGPSAPILKRTIVKTDVVAEVPGHEVHKRRLLSDVTIGDDVVVLLDSLAGFQI